MSRADSVDQKPPLVLPVVREILKPLVEKGRNQLIVMLLERANNLFVSPKLLIDGADSRVNPVKFDRVTGNRLIKRGNPLDSGAIKLQQVQQMAPQPLAPLLAVAALETGVYVREFILDKVAVRQVRDQVTQPLKIHRIKRMG